MNTSPAKIYANAPAVQRRIRKARALPLAPVDQKRLAAALQAAQAEPANPLAAAQEHLNSLSEGARYLIRTSNPGDVIATALGVLSAADKIAAALAMALSETTRRQVHALVKQLQEALAAEPAPQATE